MSKENLTKMANITVQAREVDFVTRFGKNWEALRNIMGIMRPIKKSAGTKLVSYKTTVTLEAGNVGEGEEVPYSLAQVEPVAYGDITIEKYKKAVSIEAVAKYGADVAVEKTDDEFLNQLQNLVLGKFYTFLNTGSLTGAESTWQMALAMAKGKVLDKFASINKTVTEVVGFANILDAYQYVGQANVTVQTAFGISYIKDFLGYKTLFLLPAQYVARGKVIATPVDNIDLYYLDPNESDFKKLGLEFRVQGETNLIGFHVIGNYDTVVGESLAIMGMTLWAEYLDGIAVITVDDSFYKDLTISPEVGSKETYGHLVSEYQDDVEVNGDAVTGTLKFIEGGLAESGPLAGDGYFLCLKWSAPEAGVTSVKVGLVPSAGTGLVEGIGDPDRDIVVKVSDIVNQRFTIIQSDAAGHKNVQVFSLAGLTLEDVEA